MLRLKLKSYLGRREGEETEGERQRCRQRVGKRSVKLGERDCPKDFHFDREWLNIQMSLTIPDEQSLKQLVSHMPECEKKFSSTLFQKHPKCYSEQLAVC